MATSPAATCAPVGNSVADSPPPPPAKNETSANDAGDEAGKRGVDHSPATKENSDEALNRNHVKGGHFRTNGVRFRDISPAAEAQVAQDRRPARNQAEDKQGVAQ